MCGCSLFKELDYTRYAHQEGGSLFSASINTAMCRTKVQLPMLPCSLRACACCSWLQHGPRSLPGTPYPSAVVLSAAVTAVCPSAWLAGRHREAANAIRFAKLFSFMPEVVVPKMFTEWTTPRVLVMEWIEGERLRSASKQALVTPPAAAAAGSGGGAAAQASLRQQQQRSSPDQVAEDLRLVEIGVRCSLEQMLEEGCVRVAVLGRILAPLLGQHAARGPSGCLLVLCCVVFCSARGCDSQPAAELRKPAPNHGLDKRDHG